MVDSEWADCLTADVSGYGLSTPPLPRLDDREYTCTYLTYCLATYEQQRALIDPRGGVLMYVTFLLQKSLEIIWFVA